MICDFVTLSGELQASFNNALLSSTTLKLPIKAWDVNVNYLPADSAGNFDVAIQKSYTRVASVFAMLNQMPAANNEGVYKYINSSYFHEASAEDSSYNLSLGSRKLLDNDAVGVKEHWYHLQKCLGLFNDLAHSTSVTPSRYRSTSYMIGYDLERYAGAFASGENLSNGSQLLFRFKNYGQAADDVPRICTVAVHHQRIIAISDTSVEVFE